MLLSISNPCSLLNVMLITVSVISFCCVDTCHGSCNELDLDSLSLLNLSVSAAPPLNWSVSADCCAWEGVGCDSSSGRVTSLWLPSRGIVGTIPTSFLNLTSLSMLSLSHNGLSGPLPDGFFSSLNLLRVVDLSLNRLTGELAQWDELPATIQEFNLSSNHFLGRIHSFFFQQGLSLRRFDVSNNSFSGSIPSGVCGFSPSIQRLDFSNNEFAGSIPQGFSSCSNLVSLRAGFNNFSGGVPQDVFGLSGLEEMYFPGNRLSGYIDGRITELKSLRILELYGNLFTGMIPQNIGRLSNLEVLKLHINRLNGTIPSSLTNCTKLTTLYLRVNFLGGELSAFDFSRFVQLRSVDLGNNNFSGGLPESLFQCKTLVALRLATNSLNGEISPSITALQNLSFVSLSNNSLTNISGALSILQGCKNLKTLTLSLNFYHEQLPDDENFTSSDGFQNIQVLALGGNAFTGVIPMWIIKLAKLEVLDLSHNNLTGTIPSWVGNFQNLFYLDLSFNLLSGYFPMEFTTLRRLAFQKNSDEVDSSYLELPVFVQPYNASNQQYNQLTNLPPALYLGNNSLSGTIPVEIGQLKFILALDLSNNSFSGSIPKTISNLTNLEKLDLSGNQLSGQIPASLRNLHFLSFFNVAYNNLEGPIPTGGQFDTFPNSSFEGNPGLCGRVNPCSGQSGTITKSTKRSGISKKTVVLLTLVICPTIFALSLILFWVFSKRKIQPKDTSERNDLETVSFNSSGVYPRDKEDNSIVILFDNSKKKIEDLTINDILKATDDFNQSNIIGCGGFGLVYRAILVDGTKLAIKKLSGDMGLMEREFKAEVEALSTAQHENLVSLLGYSVHAGFRLLIYSYMEKGSLDYWLHEKPDGAIQLSWTIRLKIARGASFGVAYMHQTCEPHIVHRDLKSSNILLDQNFEARVADFGLARLILPYRTHVTTELVGTLGYIPPEYSQSWIATLRGDIYSFGVVLLELLTGKRPVELFRPKKERELVAWVQQLRNEGKQEEIFDPLLKGKGFEQEMLRVLDVACMCVNQNPMKRPTIREVVDWLENVGS
ncbi:tyrosine-sulfated glycopeptide receptor 1-like [Primulina eburnea]|uniref:tyrosine-sulfated glycopeptide receptor 1-like n=1 Tax=Primulina eburnea TaxID=1245227 RepID=UPI003C6C9F9B